MCTIPTQQDGGGQDKTGNSIAAREGRRQDKTRKSIAILAAYGHGAYTHTYGYGGAVLPGTSLTKHTLWCVRGSEKHIPDSQQWRWQVKEDMQSPTSATETYFAHLLRQCSDTCSDTSKAVDKKLPLETKTIRQSSSQVPSY